MKATPARDIRTSMIRVMSARSVHNRTVALAADLIAADARFNEWCLEVAKETLPEADLMKILDQGEKYVLTCDRAVRQFEQDKDTKALEATLSLVLARLLAYLDVPEGA